MAKTGKLTATDEKMETQRTAIADLTRQLKVEREGRERAEKALDALMAWLVNRRELMYAKVYGAQENGLWTCMNTVS